LNKNVVKWLNTLPNTFAHKRPGSVFFRGLPDVYACCKGYAIEIEGKLEGNKPTPMQESSLFLLFEAGAIVGVYHSLEEAQRIVYDGLIARGVEIEKSYFKKLFKDET
jgi:hypothetical protein